MVVKIDRPLPVKPARGYLVCERLKESTTKGGLALPDTVQAAQDAYKPMKLRVLAVGADKWNRDRTGTIPTQVKVGDIVIPAGPGLNWDFDGWELWVLDSDMVVAKVVLHD